MTRRREEPSISSQYIDLVCPNDPWLAPQGLTALANKISEALDDGDAIIDVLLNIHKVFDKTDPSIFAHKLIPGWGFP